ncbi:permease-like cell division protein FtsX [Geomobilimonas luticola]|uniref:Cell division protein FtsX n=1 Tax=Geomobilimonas luticola TaxID=1114878 RepID=A0ABS5SJ88_9BACT|nr:permease-like cell division protein FtsX [Geomobilimonas luticola]MBT0654447.1 permease-like cell division protein FtsX [Geomobilimonas luticola]
MSRNKQAKRPKLANEGFTGRLRFFVGRALLNIRQNAFVNIVTIGTITLAILIISLFMLVFVNLEGVANDWSKRVQVTAYFEQELAPEELATLKSRVLAIPGTDRVTYVSKEEAFKRFRERLKGQELLLEGITTDVLPSSVEISLKSASRNSDAVAVYVDRLKKVPGVTEVQHGEEWVRRYTTFMNFLRLAGLLLGSFLVLAVIFIVSNTIKLTIYSRKEELEILSLVGATRFFIKAPFLIEGILQGASGAGLALIILTGCYYAFLHNAGNFLSFNPAAAGLAFLPPVYSVGLFVSGVLLGFIGSATSLKRFVSV